jgi:predicted alpha/beta-fold hydrolase
VRFAPSEYRPRFTGGHLQTLFAWAKRRVLPELPPPVARHFDTAPDARVLAHCHWQPQAQACPTIVLLHGLEGSSTVHYMRGMADKAWAEGWNVVRLNQRNCGGTEALSRGLYHSALTHDPLFVVRELLERDGLPAVAIAGYSLGGNVALKLAGELGAEAPPQLLAVCAVSPTMDLAVCVQALERRGNFPYQWNFVRNLKSRVRRKAALFPDEFSTQPLGRIWTVRRFDETYTAPCYGFTDATDYYHRASAMRHIDRIAVPTLILTAENDPFVPPAPFRDPLVTGNPAITAIVTREGGHCAFLEQPAGRYDGYWAEREVVRFATEAWRQGAASTPSRTRDLSLPVRA